MHLDVVCWHWATKVVSDGSISLIDLKVHWCLEQCSPTNPSCCSHGVVVAWRVSLRHNRLFSTLHLTSLLMSSYTHPLGRVCWQYFAGIFIVLLDGCGQLINQHDGICTQEAKSHQIMSERGKLPSGVELQSWGNG